MAGLRRGELVLGAGGGGGRIRGEQPEIVQRAEAFQGRESQEVGMIAHAASARIGFMFQASVMITRSGAKVGDGPAEPVADCVGVPGAVAEVEGLRVDRQGGLDPADRPSRGGRG